MDISVKDIIVKRIDSKSANAFIKKWHYSGKIVNNSNLHFGCFLGEVLHGVLSFGASLDKGKIQGLVRDTGWSGFLELNRMAFDEILPKNSESRCLSICLRLIKKHNPHIKWVISFADATQCGDGTQYRACGFILTGIKENKNLIMRGDGIAIHKMTLESNPTSPRQELGGKSYYDITGGKYSLDDYVQYVNGAVLVGYQLRYIYFLDNDYREKLTVPEIPYNRIDEMKIGMYRGVKKDYA
jgi:cellobiose-specific phosphotransferase system component IIB